MKGFALWLVLKQRHERTRKWSITYSRKRMRMYLPKSNNNNNKIIRISLVVDNPLCDITQIYITKRCVSVWLHAAKHMISNRQIHARTRRQHNTAMRQPSKNNTQVQDYWSYFAIFRIFVKPWLILDCFHSIILVNNFLKQAENCCLQDGYHAVIYELHVLQSLSYK